jgi:hypothetical protein
MFDVRHGDDRYSIGRLIIDRAGQLALTRSEIVTRLGYRNLSKGHRLVSGVLTTGMVPTFIAGHLSAALDIEPDVVQTAMAETAAQRRAEAAAQREAEDREYRASFRPHLRVETECERPSPIFLVAMLGLLRLRIVPISDAVWTADDIMRERIVRSAITDHYRRCGGRLPAFGKIVGYALVTAAASYCDLGFPYDVQGNGIGPLCSVRRLGSATWTVKGKPAPASLVLRCSGGETPPNNSAGRLPAVAMALIPELEFVVVPLMLLMLALRHWHIGLPLAAVVFICLVWQPFSTGFDRGWRRSEAERGVPHMSLGDRLGAAPGWLVEGFRQGYNK